MSDDDRLPRERIAKILRGWWGTSGMDPYFALVVLAAFWSGVFLTLGAMEQQNARATSRPLLRETDRP
jgi:hypothetical protein